MEIIQSNIILQWSQHCKSMGIFPDAHGQLTLQSVEVSGQISSLSKLLWLFLLPAKLKIQSKIRG